MTDSNDNTGTNDYKETSAKPNLNPEAKAILDDYISAERKRTDSKFRRTVSAFAVANLLALLSVAVGIYTTVVVAVRETVAKKADNMTAEALKPINDKVDTANKAINDLLTVLIPDAFRKLGKIDQLRADVEERIQKELVNALNEVKIKLDEKMKETNIEAGKLASLRAAIEKLEDENFRFDEQKIRKGLVDLEAFQKLLKIQGGPDALVNLQTRIEAVLPIGSIIAWHRDVDTNAMKPLELPTGWQLCDGALIREGPLADKRLHTPDLNNKSEYHAGGRFLRGGTKSGEFGDGTLVFDGQVNLGETKRNLVSIPRGNGVKNDDGRIYLPSQSYSGFESPPENELQFSRPFAYVHPVNMSVVWIMRVK